MNYKNEEFNANNVEFNYKSVKLFNYNNEELTVKVQNLTIKEYN